VSPRAGLDDVQMRKLLPLPGLELQPLCRPARSQSLYRLPYPGSPPIKVTSKMLTDYMIEMSLAHEVYL
jgi:hypothetical protein